MVTNDPLLPGRILPSDDPGQPALVAVRKDRRRVEMLRDASRQLRTLNPEKTGASLRVTQDILLLHMQHEVGKAQP